ncbi:leukocyte receptor cluster member 1 homolog [Pectinophora gossypiella]|uniref:leukocyte receptor cluster member 1 homolog n=1 Tax=Pectinophora gossypiella TaxID=13191 RepID=UPI00214E5728|nr:leukocyte receptor cluster member 1 homolog [Pectinophora gossypiella]
MNILPKKRWHVRTKENIARVRKDEAEAAEKERQERLRIETADREARLNVLKLKSKQKLEESGITETNQLQQSATPSQHINLFEDLDHAVKSTNKEHDKEVKEKKEEYEKKIGYLTYLGQDTNEALRKKNWYEVAPEASRFSRSNDIKDTYDKLVLKDDDGKPKTKEFDVTNGEVAWKAKQRLDPLNAFKKYCPEKIRSQPKPTKSTSDSLKTTERCKDKKILKKNKKDKVEKNKMLQKLREARLKREMEEKRKTELFLTQLHEPTPAEPKEHINKVKPKYNSQFNPELARQNYR